MFFVQLTIIYSNKFDEINWSLSQNQTNAAIFQQDGEIQKQIEYDLVLFVSPGYYQHCKMQDQNTSVRRNSLIFGILTIFIHTIACFMFGFFFNLPEYPSAGAFSQLFIAFAHGMLVLVGFGLLFSYLKKMVWTGMGFSLLITALTVEIYFMINCLWTKARIMYSEEESITFSDIDKTYDLFLTNLASGNDYMPTLTGAFRCSLAMMVAFSSIMGRAGYLEALFVCLFGTIGYELNRHIIENYTNDSGGSSSIFIFGGFMGLAMGAILRLKEKEDSETKMHENYTANSFSAGMALIGTLFTWIFFPILAMDFVDTEVASHTYYTGPLTVWYALAASTIVSFIISPLFNNGILIRDIVYGPIAGGIASSTASYFIVNPVFGILIGFVAGFVQITVMNLIQKSTARNKSIMHSFSFTLFGIQGMLGGCFSAIWYVAVKETSYDFVYVFPDDWSQLFTWITTLISMPMGLGFGVLVGLFCLLVTKHDTIDHFNDFTYWREDDGIRQISGGASTYQTDPNEFAVQEGEMHKNKHAYL